MVRAARSLCVAADTASLLLVATIGERLRRGAGLLAALIVACSPIMIGASRAIYTDPVMAALALAALARMQAYRGGGVTRTPGAGALGGPAFGGKFPAAVRGATL